MCNFIVLGNEEGYLKLSKFRLEWQLLTENYVRYGKEQHCKDKR